MNAAGTYTLWLAACRNSALGERRGRAENLLHHGGEIYCIDPNPAALQNGALTGRVYRFTKTGLSDVGGFKIAGDGRVEYAPTAVWGALPGTEASCAWWSKIPTPVEVEPQA